MASAQIQTLLRGPDTALSQKLALDYLNSHFKSLADLEDQSLLDKAVQDAQGHRDELHKRVRTAYRLSLAFLLSRVSQLSSLALKKM